MMRCNFSRSEIVVSVIHEVFRTPSLAVKAALRVLVSHIQAEHKEDAVTDRTITLHCLVGM